MSAQFNFDQMFDSLMTSAEKSRQMVKIQSEALTAIVTSGNLSSEEMKNIAFEAIQQSSKVLINKEVQNA